MLSVQFVRLSERVCGFLPFIVLGELHGIWLKSCAVVRRQPPLNKGITAPGRNTSGTCYML